MKIEEGIILVTIGYLIGAGKKSPKIPVPLNNTKCTSCTKPGTAKNPIVMMPQTSKIKVR